MRKQSKEPKTFSNSSDCNENIVRGEMCKAPLTGRRRPTDLYRAEKRLAFIFESREVSDHFCLQHLLQLVAVGTAERSAQHQAAGMVGLVSPQTRRCLNPHH